MSHSDDLNRRSSARSDLLSRLTAIVLALFLLAFFGVTLNNTVAINGQVQAVREGAYPVSVAAGRVETLLVQLRTISERPAYVRTPEASQSLRASFQGIDAGLSTQLSFIAENHSSDPEAAASLASGYDQLASNVRYYIGMVTNPAISDTAVREYAESSIYPLIDDLLAIDIEILDESTEVADTMYTTVTTAGHQTLIVSCVLMAAVVFSLTVYLTILRRKSDRENQLRASLEEALILAQSANAAKSTFLSNMSHDIRTPMNAIVGLTAIAHSHLDDPIRVKECLSRITTSSKHLLGLINDVLDMGKIESGKMSLNEEPFSFPDLIGEFVTIVQPQARAKKLRFDVVIGNIEREMVIGDTMRINQVLMNLAGNAVKYTEEGDVVRISVSEEPSLQPGFNNYRFVVHDTGIGMDAEFLERIFDPFEREGNDKTPFIEGTGLGMSITKNIVDLMGGTITVESQPGVGSTFTVVIPLRPYDEAAEELDVSCLEGIRVLVVDDDRDVLENTKNVLDGFGMRGDCSATGNEAVSLTAQAFADGDGYEAIIVDWIMPGMDGLETIRQIRDKVGDATPIVLVSAYDWTEIEEEASQAGVSAFVSKPLFRSRLYHVLRAVCVDGGVEEVAHGSLSKHPLSGRVLLVEDNELNREIATELIEQLGAEVECACDGEEAVSMTRDAEEGHYQLIFMDWQMPRLDGIEATRAIIAYEQQMGRAHVPIVAMTANAFNEDRRRALEAGMDGFMAKPINLAELERNLRTYLE
ncbi:response regulator [Enterorhabdus sp. P55]|uniref:response regulator n=1 Tax=Enterorhabdus sp. P55 TaxID=2304571 RepID=UPI00136BDF1E|nr:response regulator [Enterorhabdus sp. P55]